MKPNDDSEEGATLIDTELLNKDFDDIDLYGELMEADSPESDIEFE